MIKRYTLISCFLLASLFACQTEQNFVLPLQGTLNTSSPLSKLLMRVSQHPTALDNVIDSTSCFSVALPVSLMVNDQQVIVLSEAGYETVAYIMNQSDSDTDNVNFVFPITVVFKDSEALPVTSQVQLDTIMDNCGAETEAEIRCIDINYPITFNTYDSDNQIADVVVIANDQQLYGFLDMAGLDFIMSVVYPVSLTRADGQEVIVDSNIAFEEAIESAIGSCLNTPGGSRLQ